MSTKLVIVWRQELKELPLGKKMAQAGHASHMFLTEDRIVTVYTHDGCYGDSFNGIVLTDKEIAWITDKYRKVVLTTRTLDDLLMLKAKAEELGVTAKLIEDAGFTCFEGPTVTCLSLGPDTDEVIDSITGESGPLGKLKLA